MVIWLVRHIVFLFWNPVLRRVLLNYRCLSVSPSIWHFSLFFMIFGTMVDNQNILKTDNLFFSRKNNFCPNYGPKCCQIIILQDPLECNANKHGSLLQVNTIILGVCNQACPKCQNKKFTYLCNILKSMRYEVNFFACR